MNGRESRNERKQLMKWNGINWLISSAAALSGMVRQAFNWMRGKWSQSNSNWLLARWSAAINGIGWICFLFLLLFFIHWGSGARLFQEEKRKQFHQLFLSIIEIDWMKGRIVELMKGINDCCPSLFDCCGLWPAYRPSPAEEDIPESQNFPSLSSLGNSCMRREEEWEIVKEERIKGEWKREIVWVCWAANI